MKLDQPVNSTNAMFQQLLQEARGVWRFRWYAMAVAWIVFAVGVTAVSALPNVYEASARIYVDASTRLRPLLQGLAVDTNIDAQVQYVRQTLLSRPHLLKLVDDAKIVKQPASPQKIDRAVEAMRTRIQIDSSRGSGELPGRVYSITFQDPRSDTALAVVRSVVNSFVEGSHDTNRAQSEQAQEFLHEQLREVETRLSGAEERLAAFKRANFGMLPGQGGDFFTRMQTERDGLERATADYNVLLSQRGELLRQLRGETPVVPVARHAAGPAAPEKDLDSRLKEAEAKREDLLIRYTEKHPEVIALTETIKELRARRAQEIEALNRGGSGTGSLAVADNPLYQNIRIQLNKVEVDLAAARGELSDRQQRIAELRRIIDTAPEVEAELARLNRDYGANKAQYDALLDRLQKAKLSEQAEETGSFKFEVIEPPAAKMTPVGPKRLLMILAAFCAAVGSGVVFAYLLQQLKPVFSSVASLAHVTGLPVLGTVGMIGREDYLARRRGSVLRYCTISLALIAVCAAAVLGRDYSAAWFQQLLG